MKVDFEWASYTRLIEQQFFYRTATLCQLERTLGTPIPDSLHWTRRFEYPWILEKIVATDKLLDVGSGSTALQFFLSNTSHVSAVDVDPAAVEWINSRRSDQLIKNPMCILGGLPNLPFSTNEFGIVICISVLEHLPKAQVLPSINDMLRVCNKSVLLTMDIALEKKHERQTDFDDLCKMTKELGFDCPSLPPHPLAFNMDGYDFGVACIQLHKT
jgi:2-polyprenyl-3-methyl-5-hydroxy-6-metoxy-1,4-benzoquinol methylase